MLETKIGVKFSKEIRAGFIVVVTLAVFFILFNFLKGKNVFVNGRVFYAKYENVNGLQKSKPVTMNGLRVGRVDGIQIMDKQQPIYFVVKITVERDVEFSKNTKAEIYEPGFLSGKEIRLLLDYNGTKAESGDTLQGATAASLTSLLSEQIGPTKDRVDSLLISLNDTSEALQKIMDEENSDNLKQVLRNLNGTLGTFRQTANSISKTSESANRLIANNSDKLGGVIDNANSVMDDTKGTIHKYGELAEKFNSLELETTLANLESTSKKLDNLMTKVQSNDGTLGAMMNDKTMYNNLNETSVALKELMEDFKENPKRYVHFSVFGKKDKKDKKEVEEIID